MSLSVVRGFTKVARLLPCTRTTLSNSSLSQLVIPNTRTITRSLFFLSRSRDSSGFKDTLVHSPTSQTCGCGCGLHTKGDKELVAFLDEEIANETKVQTSPGLPPLEGFEVKYEDASVTFTRKLDNEVITVKANVNHAVDAEEPVGDPNDPKEAMGEMKCKPDFTVEVTKGKKTLSFHCCYSEVEPEEEASADAYNDSFQVTEVSMYEGEFKESTYSVSGEIMDGYLYDLLMNYLDERGVTSEFADKMIAFFSSYEHKLYIELLKNMKKFVEK